MTAASQSSPKQPTASAGGRLRWLDGIKGLSILWIAYFHCYEAYINKGLPSPLDADYFARLIHQLNPQSAIEYVAAIVEGIYAAVAGVGFHAVGVFIVMSGFGLSFSLARMDGPPNGWRAWYASRVVRLFPMYWAAHLVYLISPFEARLEPVDHRFLLSFLGDRVFPIYTMFYYLNPAWWYFGLILELYLVVPLLWALMKRVGTGWFLVICAAETILSRYVFMFVLQASGYYLLGAFFGCRLWEFALGMLVGVWYWKDREWVYDQLFSMRTLVVGIVLYTLGLYSYESSLTYTVTDALIGTGLFVILANIALALRHLPKLEAAVAYVGVLSYGFYLIHQPYVIRFGEFARGWSMPTFALVAIIPVAALAYGASYLESWVNGLTDQFLRKKDAKPEAGIKRAAQA
ncbi:MAG TPA: acyltransferase [Candidatus Binataceae bacterium]|nr:acyltransferase [Candidatus Binataceae bacterium]